MDISHDHTDFGPQIPFLGSEDLFSPFLPPKVCLILFHVKFPNDGCFTRPYWFWAPNSVFGLWRLIFSFLASESIFFVALCKIPEWWIYHTTILILGPNFFFGLWRFNPPFKPPPFKPPKISFFLLHIKFPNDRYITRPYWFLAPNSVFGLWRLIFAFFASKCMFNFVPCKIPERWMFHSTTLILGPKFRFWALKACFFLYDPWKYVFCCSM
jgi:hypothetical protein